MNRSFGISVAVVAALAITWSPAGTIAAQDGRSRVGGTGTLSDAGYRLRTIDSRQGLSHNVTFALLQDRRGFVWIGTIDGLNRFDGRDFRIYRHDPEDPSSLSNGSVRRLWEGPDGDLWVRTEAGLDRMDPRSGGVRRYPVAAHEFAPDEDGRLLVADADGLHLYQPDRDAFEALLTFPLLENEASPSAADPVWGLATRADGGVWIGTERGHLFEVDPTGRVRHRRSPWRQLLVLGADAGSGRLWVGHAEGLGRYDPGGASFESVEGVSGPILAALVEPGKEPWFVGEGMYGLTSDEAGDVAGRQLLPELASTSVWSVLRSRDGVVWLATSRGLRLLDPYAKPFRNHRHDPARQSSLAGDAVLSVAEDDRGRLWVGTLAGGVSRLDVDSGRARRYAPPAGAAGAERIWALLAGTGERVWAGTGAGLYVLDAAAERFERVPLVGTHLAGGDAPIVFVLERDRTGDLWAGTSAGLYRVDPASGRARRVPLGDSGDAAGPLGVEGLEIGADGVLWVGLRGGDLARLDSRTLTVERIALGADSRLRGSEGFWEILERPDGELWLASDRGLFVLDPRDGSLVPHELSGYLPTTAVYSLAVDREGSLWLGTADGLLRQDGGAAAPGLALVRHYTTADGLAHAEFNRRAVTGLADGRLAFGTMGGVTVFDPGELGDNPHPPEVAITGVERLRRGGSVRVDVAEGESVRLAHDDAGLVIEFAALTFTSPERATRVYRLEGVDAGWVRAGSESRARYPALGPGTYRFRVRAANADGVWNHAGASLELVVPPPWWATTWFRVAAGTVLLVGLVLAVRQVSTRRLRRRVRDLELERELRLERERISRDLHDNVGSQVSTILAGVELAQLAAREPAAADVEKLLEVLDEDARRTMTQLRETVWSLHEDRVTVSDLVDQLRQHVAERGRYAEPELIVASRGDGGLELDSGRALQLFRIAQEAISNAVRHAGASSVRVLVRAEPEAVRLEVRDDGTFREPASGRRGFGLRGMAARAEQMGGRWELDKDGGGTTVRVELPLD